MASKSAGLHSDVSSHSSDIERDNITTQQLPELKGSESILQPFVPPDGGLEAWLSVLGGFCCLFVSFGFLNACGMFQLYYEENLLRQYNASTISWITTVALFLMYVGGPVFGLLADKKGPRTTLIPAAILIVFAICMLSLSTEFYQVMLSEGIAFGIGAGALFLSPMVNVSRWFTRKRGLATGIVAAGSGLGGVVFPVFIPNMIEQHGFAAAVRWTALLMGCMLLIAVVTVRRPSFGGPQPSLAQNPQWWRDLWSAPWLLYFAGCFFIMWGFFAPFNYLPLFASVRAHSSEHMSDYIVSITNSFSVVGRVFPGLLADKFGPFNVMTGVALASGVLTLVFWLPLQYHPSAAGVICFGAAYGFVSGGFVALMAPCVAVLSRGQLGDLGKRMGSFLVVIAFAALSGLPIQGAIKDSADTDDFVGLITFAGTVMTIGGLFMTASAVTLRRQIVKEQR